MRLTAAGYSFDQLTAVSCEGRKSALLASSCSHEVAEGIQQPIRLKLTTSVLQLTCYPVARQSTTSMLGWPIRAAADGPQGGYKHQQSLHSGHREFITDVCWGRTAAPELFR